MTSGTLSVPERAVGRTPAKCWVRTRTFDELACPVSLVRLSSTTPDDQSISVSALQPSPPICILQRHSKRLYATYTLCSLTTFLFLFLCHGFLYELHRQNPGVAFSGHPAR